MSEAQPMGWGARAGILASNLLPAFGVILLGWPAAPAVFLLWLDSWLGILELAAQAMISATRQKKAEKPEHFPGCVWAGWWVGMLIAAIALSSPALVAGAGLVTLLTRNAPGDPWLGILAGRGILGVAAFAAALRIIRIVDVMRSETLESFRAAAPSSYTLLACRCFVMYGLAFIMRGLGRFGLAAFLVAASAALTFLELNGKNLFRRGFGAD